MRENVGNTEAFTPGERSPKFPLFPFGPQRGPNEGEEGGVISFPRRERLSVTLSFDTLAERHRCGRENEIIDVCLLL